MKKLFNTNRAPAPRADSAKDQAIRKRLLNAAALDSQALLESLGTAAGGLDEAAVRRAREEHGTNVFTSGKKASAPKRLLLAFVNPFTAVLLALALISVFTEVVFAAPGDKNYVTVLIITVMVLISGALRFIQETRSGNVAARLSGMLHTTTCVERD